MQNTVVTQPLPPAPRLFGNAVRLAPHEVSRCLAAAGHARRIYPGALGELIHRELTAYAEFGCRFGMDALVPRLVATVLATSSAVLPEGEPG